MLAIKTDLLTKFYGKTRGIEGINLQIPMGEVFGFIGPNGAGKSTTIRTLMQLIYPTSGNVELLGVKLTGDMGRLRRRIGYLPSEINYYKELTGRQLLEFSSSSFGVSKSLEINEYAAFLELDLSKPIKSYSLGNRKKLGIIQSLLHDPELLILDEPTSGLDPLIQNRFFELLNEKRSKGMTIFLSTHVLTEVDKICDRVGIVRKGRLIQVSTVDDIPGRAEKRIEVKFEEHGNLIEKLELSRLDKEVSYREGVHVFRCTGKVHELLHSISEHPIEDIAIVQPSLEELFMQYYGNGEN